MEIGHNVMHGQYDWMKDPALDSKRFEWDTACPGDQWRHSHNYMHHTHTNVLGKDRDIGYGILRMSEDQPWRPRDLGNPIYATLLALLFQWGVAVHDLEVERIEAGEIDVRRQARDPAARSGARAAARCSRTTSSSRCWPGPARRSCSPATLTANLTRNVWSFMIIFCGHFPEGVEEFTEEETENETRGGWYLRQMLGSANLTGGRLFHILSGNLSPPDRAPPVPRHPGPPLRRDRGRGARDLRALRPALQRRPAAPPVRLGGQEDRPPGPSRPRRAGPAAPAVAVAQTAPAPRAGARPGRLSRPDTPDWRFPSPAA